MAKLPTFTLGWELEAIDGPSVVPEGIVRDTDPSVHGKGLEYVVRPSHIELKKSVATLRSFLKERSLKTDESCGFHVHIGVQGARRSSPKMRAWAGAFVSLAREAEGPIFEAVPESRRTNDQFCQKMAGRLAQGGITAKRYNPHKYSNPERYYWVNVVEMMRQGGIHTIEIRLMGDTHDALYLLAWIGFCLYMAEKAWRLMEDMSMLPFYAAQLAKQAVRLKRRWIDGETLTPSKAELVQDYLRRFGAIAEERPLASLLNSEYRVEYTAWRYAREEGQPCAA